MKWNCDWRETRRAAAEAQAYEKFSGWHPYFAWLPIRVGHGDCRWLETIERQIEYLQYGSKSSGGIRYLQTDVKFRARSNGKTEAV